MKNLTVSLFKDIDDLPKLLKYFMLSPKNKVIVQAETINVYFKIYMDDDGIFHKLNMTYNIDLTCDLSISDLIAIISQVKEQESDGNNLYNYKDKNKWQEICLISSSCFNLC